MKRINLQEEEIESIVHSYNDVFSVTDLLTLKGDFIYKHERVLPYKIVEGKIE